MTRTNRVMRGFAIAIFLFSIFFITTLIFKDYLAAEFTKKWPLVDAIVLNSSVVQKVGNKGRTYYCDQIKISYVYQNLSMTSFLETQDSNCGAPQEEITRYPQGKVIRVHINPAEPTQVRSMDFSLNSRAVLMIIVDFILVLLLHDTYFKGS